MVIRILEGINMMAIHIHESVTADRALEACEESMFELSSPGFCHACGADHDGIDPDARRCRCDDCGANQVFGAEETLLIMAR